MTKELLFIVTLVLCLVKWCDGGECCWTNGHTAEVWCDKYCCINMCCDNELLRKPASDRQFICPAFFASNLWAPVVVIFAAVAMFFGCCMFCLKCSYW